MNTFTFDSKIELGQTIQKRFSTDEIKNEPMLFGCDLKHAIKYGGPITDCFVETLLKDGRNFRYQQNLRFDSRVHMLMPGWYPCIPGHHHDAIPRTRLDGQPDYSQKHTVQHCLMLVNGDIAPTEFAIGKITLPDIEPGEKYYKKWHPLVEQSNLEKVKCPSNQLVYFDADTFHTGTKAVANGWRFFIRVSLFSKEPIQNELRRQVQVYLENPVEGW